MAEVDKRNNNNNDNNNNNENNNCGTPCHNSPIHLAHLARIKRNVQ